MKKMKLSKRHRLINMAIFASLFMLVPFFFTTLVEKFTPVEYFVDVQGVEVGNPVTGEHTREPRIPQDVLDSLVVGERYYWTWVFEFDVTKNRTEIVTKDSNSFELLPSLESQTIQLELLPSLESQTIQLELEQPLQVKLKQI